MALFLAALFALVSRWTIAYLMVALACVFYLTMNRLSRRRYTEAFTQALMVYSLSEPFIPVSYAASQDTDDLLWKRGLIPEMSCVPGAKLHHVLHGLLKNVPFSISEAAFVRKANRGMLSIAGTLVTADHILPSQENWVILLRDPFAGFCSMEEYVGFEPVARRDTWPGGNILSCVEKHSVMRLSTPASPFYSRFQSLILPHWLHRMVRSPSLPRIPFMRQPRQILPSPWTRGL